LARLRSNSTVTAATATGTGAVRIMEARRTSAARNEWKERRGKAHRPDRAEHREQKPPAQAIGFIAQLALVFMTSHVAPSRQYPITSATPVRMLNGVSQSHQPPA